jgi:hypothetical protein
MKWCAYYGDGSKFSYLDGNVKDVPPAGVQYVAQEDSTHGYVALSNFDYYLWDDRGDGEKWYCADIVGYWLYMLKPGWKKVLFGEWIGDSRYEEISKQVSNDIQVARKTGFAPWEK